jgi:hypothetical protein
VTTPLSKGHVEGGDGVGEPLWQRSDMFIHIAANVGIHLAQNEGLYAVKQERTDGVDDSLKKRK